MELKIKRAYEPPDPSDGVRILVDRYWPRGRSRSALRIDLWLKSVAPSEDLRRWFAHDCERWEAFKARYFAELDRNPEALRPVQAALARGPVTLVYAAKNERCNHARALAEYLRSRQA